MRISDWSSDVCSSDLMIGSGDGQRKSCGMRGLLVTAMLVVAVLGSSGSQARARAIGDAVVAAGGRVDEVEQAVTAWLERVWGRVSAPDRESRADEAFRILLWARSDDLRVGQACVSQGMHPG